MKEVSAKTLTVYYVAALTIIAALSIAGHFVVARQLRLSESTAALINLSGRQRMLSQRIASMAAQYRLGDSGARAELLSSTDAFEQGHRTLLDAIKTGSLDAENSDLRSIYETGPASLDIESRAYVAEARQIAATAPDDPALQGRLAVLFAEARTPLLRDLERAVAIRQKAADLRVHRMQRIQFWIISTVLATLVLEALTIFSPMVRRIVRYHEELIIMATTDQLTGASNRRSFMDFGVIEFSRAKRYARPLSLLALDVDHFKAINDRFGHAAGDKVLQELSSVLTECLRLGDLLGRIGGEEFAILLPETSIAAAGKVAERLRGAVAAMQVTFDDKVLELTVSIGAVEVSSAMANLSDAMIVADAALYRAKHGGRNQVVCDEIAV